LVETSTIPTDRKLGFVLSGGGFRGAYQAGFLKAAEDLQCRPIVISGSSVGALNAVILRYLAAGKLWSYWEHKTTFRAMYRLHPIGLLLRLLTTIFLLPWLLHYSFFKNDRYGDRWSQAIADTEARMRTNVGYVCGNSNYILSIAILIASLPPAILLNSFIPLTPIQWVLVTAVSTTPFIFAPRICRLLEMRNVTALESLISARMTELIPQGTAARANAPDVVITVSHAVELFNYANPFAWQTTVKLIQKLV